jgi:hypothetical protein
MPDPDDQFSLPDEGWRYKNAAGIHHAEFNGKEGVVEVSDDGVCSGVVKEFDTIPGGIYEIRAEVRACRSIQRVAVRGVLCVSVFPLFDSHVATQ